MEKKMARTLGFDPIYPLVPLKDEERDTMEGRPWANLERFPTRVQAAAIYEEYQKTAYKAAEAIFFKGGKVSDHGWNIKPDVDMGVAYEVLQAILMSPYPNYMQREGAITLALTNWFEPPPGGLSGGSCRDCRGAPPENEPSLERGFFKPGTRGFDANDIMHGKNRN